MTPTRRLLACLTLSLPMLLTTRSVEAACVTNPALGKKAYTDWWIQRTATACACEFWANRVDCAPTNGYRGKTPTLITTLASSCSTSCEDTTGYATTVATVTGKYAPATGNYECDTTFTDNDGDRAGQCIDENDRDPRIWVKANSNEDTCDGVDNDNDGTIDDGFTPACAFDQKRLHQSNLFQGDSTGKVHLIDGSLSRSETDAVVQGPYGPLVLARNYNSRHLSNEAALGLGWTHSFAIYLQQLPSGDGRWRVLTPSGEAQYFRCTSFSSGAEQACAIDDHRLQGNLRRTASVWYWYPGDGSVVQFSETVISGRRLWSSFKNNAGFVLASATGDASGRVQQVTSANSSIFLYFVYGTYGLSAVRLSSTSGNQILAYTVSSSSKLELVQFASTVGTIDVNNYVDYVWNASSYRIDSIRARVANPPVVTTIAAYGYDASNRVTTIQDANKDLSFGNWASVVGTTTVTINVDTSYSSQVLFTHNKGLWVTSRNSDLHVGGMDAKLQAYDEHGRVTCSMTDDGRIRKYDYTNSRLPIALNEYAAGGTCASPGTSLRKTWYAWEANGNQSMRQKWQRTLSVLNTTAADCSAEPLNALCAETRYFYLASDDRIQTIQTTGRTRLINDQSIQQQVRARRSYYFGLDTTVCTSADSYPGLPCRVEAQDGSGAPKGRSTFTYYSSGSGAYAGLPKTVADWDKNVDLNPQTTTYSSYNLFGTPTSVTDPAGMVTSFTSNGWNALTQITKSAALLDAGSPPVASLSPSWQYTYTQSRDLDAITLPKGNKLVYRYWTGAGGYGRTKAFATADASGNLLEIMRYDYDMLGSRKQTKLLNSISGTTPCADENCTTYDVFRDQKYDANRRLVEAYLHRTSSSITDATKYYTYNNGRLSQIEDYKGIKAQYSYTGLGQLLSSVSDVAQGGLQATTVYTYDVAGQRISTTSPESVVTATEHDDFGQLTLERSKTRGDIRYEYDSAGNQTKRQWSAYNSTLNAQSTCYTWDWLGRMTKSDPDCDVNGATWLYYDGDHAYSGACPAATRQNGRLSLISDSNGLNRSICYHPDGHVFAAFAVTNGIWSNTSARGTSQVFDLNGNTEKVFLWDRPADRTTAREVNYVYDTTLKDRVSYVQHKLTGAPSYTLVTSNTSLPTYEAFGGFKYLWYANGVLEANARNLADWRTIRTTLATGTVYTDINLTYDVNGNITIYDDTNGLRHFKHHAALDTLNRLRCSARSAIGSCTGQRPWEDTFNESIDYDLSGNRTNRRYGAFVTAEEKDEGAYT